MELFTLKRKAAVQVTWSGAGEEIQKVLESKHLKVRESRPLNEDEFVLMVTDVATSDKDGMAWWGPFAKEIKLLIRPENIDSVQKVEE